MAISESTTAIIVAAVALAGTIITAVVSTWFAFWSDERKRRRELKKFFAKYQDALLLAAQDLQSRLYNMTDYKILAYYGLEGESHERDNLLLYTAFAVGQYLSWVHIIRRQAQFLQYETEKTNTQLTAALAAVAYEWSTDSYAPFRLWRGDQMAIGELMTVKEGPEGAELTPMGYGTFHQKWNAYLLERRPYHFHDEKMRRTLVVLGTGQHGADERRQHEETEPGMTQADLATEKNPEGEPGRNSKEPEHVNLEIGVRDFSEWFHPIILGVVLVAKAKLSKTPSPVAQTV